MNQAEIKRRQAQAISTILAFVTLAVIARVTGYNGVTYVAAALEACAFVYTIVSGGVSETLGKLLRIKNSKGQYKNAALMRRNIMLFQVALGAVGTAVILVAAEKIAEKLFRIQYSSFILMIFAPAVLLRSVSAVLLGYSKGEGAELPAAAAGILRQVFTLGFSLIFCRMLGNYGSKVSRLLAQENFTSMYGGVGVAIAATLTEIFVIIFLIMIYRAGRRPKNKTVQDGMRTTASFMDCIRALCGSRGIQAGIQLLTMLSVPMGLIFLQKAGGGSEKTAVEYGVYIAGYGVVCGILSALVMFLLLPMCGRTVVLLRKEEHRFARTVFQGGVHIGMVHAGFLTVFVFAMAQQLAAAFCFEQAEIAAKMFRGGALIVLSAPLTLYFARVLLLTGKKYFVLGALAAADVVYAVAVTVLLNTGKTGILALVYAGMACSAVLCIVLGSFAYRQLRLKADWLQVLVVPIAAACVAGLIGMLLGRVFTPHLGNLITVLVCLALTSVLYWAGLLLLRNFREQELEVIPGGKLIIAAGQMLRVM